MPINNWQWGLDVENHETLFEGSSVPGIREIRYYGGRKALKHPDSCGGAAREAVSGHQRWHCESNRIIQPKPASFHGAQRECRLGLRLLSSFLTNTHIYIYMYIYILAPIPRSNLTLVHTGSGVSEKVVVVLRFLDIFGLLVAYYERSTSRGDRQRRPTTIAIGYRDCVTGAPLMEHVASGIRFDGQIEKTTR